jgi:hypothetical protein
MYLLGSEILYRGETWTVLGIVDGAAVIGQASSMDTGPERLVTLPAAWRGYAALTATLDAEQRAERLDIRGERHLRRNRPTE